MLGFEWFSIEKHFTFIWCRYLVDYTNQRSLPGTVRTKETKHTAFFYFDANIIECSVVSVGFSDVSGFKNGNAHRLKVL
jgi:hypothetical protein